MECIEALKTRRSVRAYTGEPLSRAVIEDIVDCGRLAATAINLQPWEFVVVTDAQMLSAIAAATDYGKFIARAAACVVVLCRGMKYYLEDGCNASQNILVAARAHGLGACWVAGDKNPMWTRSARWWALREPASWSACSPSGTRPRYRRRRSGPFPKSSTGRNTDRRRLDRKYPGSRSAFCDGSCQPHIR